MEGTEGDSQETEHGLKGDQKSTETKSEMRAKQRVHLKH